MDQKKCGIVGCNRYHNTSLHVCEVCCTNCTHVEENCPKKCKVIGCTGGHTTRDHTCKVCGMRSDHVEINCPEKDFADRAVKLCGCCMRYVRHYDKECPSKCKLNGCNGRYISETGILCYHTTNEHYSVSGFLDNNNKCNNEVKLDDWASVEQHIKNKRHQIS